MSHRQNVEQNLQRFADGIGLGELKLNEFGACGLCFDDTMVVNMEYLEQDEALVFVASVKELAAYSGEVKDLFEKVLFLNLQHQSMQGAYASLNHDKTELLLIKSMPASIDYGSYESNLEKFVNTLEWLIAEINNENTDSTVIGQQSGSQGQSSSSGTPPPPAEDMGIMV